jgi:hypothetical protein
MTAGEMQAQVNLIQEVMAQVMQDKQHYGTIPGCGDKPTLLKPGAEKLCLTFRLRPVINPHEDVMITDLSDGHRDVMVTCHILNMEGVELATGLGSCSTMENKYRYRGGVKESTGKPVPAEYWNLKDAGKMKEAIALIGGPGHGVGKFDGAWTICIHGEKAENPDIADTYNTVLKMAKKRAMVDGILSATAASDIFTQDVEDMPREAFQGRQSSTQKAETRPPVQQPQKAEQAPTVENFGETRHLQVREVLLNEGVNPKTREPYRRFKIKTSDDVTYVTFSETHANAAKDAKEMDEFVRIEWKEDGSFGFKLLSIKTDVPPEGFSDVGM